MKLLYLRTHYWFNLKAGGSVGHTAGVINSFRKKIDITIVSNDNLVGVDGNIEIVEPIKISFLPNDINELFYNYKIINHIKDKDYDVIYQRYNGFSFCGAYLANRLNIPFVLEFNSSDVWKIKYWKSNDKPIKRVVKYFYNKLIKLPIVSVIENYNLQKSNIIVVVSDVLKENLIHRGVDKSKILVNPNGIDENIYNPGIVNKEIKTKYNLDKKIVLGFIGTFGQWHGAENIAEAFGKLLSTYPKYKNEISLFMIGDGIKIKEVKEYIKKYNTQDNVIMAGLVLQSEGPKYLSVCDILINATVQNPDGSKFFGSPTKLFEYMAMEKAIICSDMDQMSDILEHNSTAFMVKPGSTDELVNAMRSLLENNDLREKLGKSARNKVVKNYTWDKHVEKILERIKNVKN